MKKLLSVFLIIMISLMLFACGECDSHVDDNGDGICDECEEKIENQPSEEDPPKEDPPAEDPPAETPPEDEPDENIETPKMEF